MKLLPTPRAGGERGRRHGGRVFAARPKITAAIGGAPQTRGRCYGAAVALVAAAAALDGLTSRALGPATPFFFYFPAVFAAGLFSGFGPGTLATALSAVAVLCLDVDPAMTLKLPDAEDAVRLAAFFCVGALMSALNELVRRTTRELSQQETRFRVLVDGMRDYAIFVMDPRGTILSWNAGAELMTGYSAAEIIGRNFGEFYPPGTTGPTPAESLRIAAEKGRFEHEDWRARKDGSRFWAGVVINAVRDEGGALIGYSKVTRDLTERKAAEDAMRAKDEQLRLHAAKLEKAVADLEAFSYTISHDLRAPLRAVEGYAYFLLKGAADKLAEDDRRLLERISASAARMDRLIQDVLAYSRVGRRDEPMTAVDLDAVVGHVLAHYPRPNEARVRVASPLGRVMGRESLLIQCVSNLLDNAVKFARAGQAAEVEVSAVRDGGAVTLSVRDDGVGIAPEHHARIFEPFVRLDPGAREGTGIGLAIVKRAAERMGGGVGVESEPGKGSRFWLTLREAR